MSHLVLSRTLHTTDEKLDGRDCRRTIRNFANYRTPAGLWLPSLPGLVEREVGIGGRGFRLAQVDAPLQAFVGDGAALAVRDSRSLDRWATLTPAGTDSRSWASVLGERVVWSELWRNAELAWTVCANRVEKLITLREPGHPVAFRFGLDLGPGQRARVDAGRLWVYDDRGSWLWTKPAWAADARGRPVRVGVRLDGTTLVIEPDAADLRRAAYPVVVDPTATISGASAIDDVVLVGLGSLNYGGYNIVGWYTNAPSPYRTLLRVATASIPAGTLTAFRWIAYFGSVPGSGTLSAYRVADANAAWVEGTGAGVSQNGSCCWLYLAYSASTPTAWAGSAGLSTSGTDYYASASPPQLTVSTTGFKTFTLDAAWATAWKAGSPNGGILTMLTSGPVSSYLANSTENASNQPYFEIDYTTGGLPPPAFFARRT